MDLLRGSDPKLEQQFARICGVLVSCAVGQLGPAAGKQPAVADEQILRGQGFVKGLDIRQLRVELLPLSIVVIAMPMDLVTQACRAAGRQTRQLQT
jgi:hypothetical protein